MDRNFGNGDADKISNNVQPPLIEGAHIGVFPTRHVRGHVVLVRIALDLPENDSKERGDGEDC